MALTSKLHILTHLSSCTSHFHRFVQLCEDAYMILRRRAALFINLLAMMVQTGIPELRSIEDLNYVRYPLSPLV